MLVAREVTEDVTTARSVRREVVPESSPDLNAIEGVWAMLRKRLDESAPLRRETRDQVVIRLRRQVCNMNKTDKQILKRLCTNQMERAKDVARLMGARTRW